MIPNLCTCARVSGGIPTPSPLPIGRGGGGVLVPSGSDAQLHTFSIRDEHAGETEHAWLGGQHIIGVDVYESSEKITTQITTA